ncbi:MAG: hypothetical protein H7Z72_25300 [Bacteroidetes bacterium]|nr:hypothetical protein [Fibrella sp.]
MLVILNTRLLILVKHLKVYNLHCLTLYNHGPIVVACPAQTQAIVFQSVLTAEQMPDGQLGIKKG